MNFRQIEVFYAVMKTGSVSGAAKLLHVSQPNITRILAHTELQLGFPLFHRHKGRLIASHQALTLLPEAEKVYRQLGSLQSLTSKLQKGHTHLRVGAPPVLSTSLFPPVVARLSQDSAISAEISTGNQNELCDALLDNQLDFAISFGQVAPPRITSQVLVHTEMVALLPRDIPSTQNAMSIVALLELAPIIGLDARDPLGMAVKQSILHHRPDHQFQLSVRSYSTAAELVIQGMGIAVVDPWTAKSYQDKLAVHPLSEPLPVSVSLLFADNSPLSSTANQLIDLLRQCLSESPIVNSELSQF
ncbi:LysR family transcriptional regulator [Photobacterium gaetbulicola]|uniref:Putative transcription regulator protein n=1 Tax=Photobacterium gaetbulicola Gung47 TaxID=658445 RepID=A0A0C5X0E0_9GAMM|nr:LysR family transcriptional regulator [Photobacterium gaetbulicola]AJR08755.1 putative transcription regulator protein [Photobacterium gaetbulicola Gung47]PSU10386.1 LysR family transcriptional regulator [Photobacterium gaetbulicola]